MGAVKEPSRPGAVIRAVVYGQESRGEVDLVRVIPSGDALISQSRYWRRIDSSRAWSGTFYSWGDLTDVDVLYPGPEVRPEEPTSTGAIARARTGSSPTEYTFVRTIAPGGYVRWLPEGAAFSGRHWSELHDVTVVFGGVDLS